MHRIVLPAAFFNIANAQYSCNTIKHAFEESGCCTDPNGMAHLYSSTVKDFEYAVPLLTVSDFEQIPSENTHRIAFGSCNSVGDDVVDVQERIFSLIAATHPNDVNLLGDNYYADGESGRWVRQYDDVFVDDYAGPKYTNGTVVPGTSGKFYDAKETRYYFTDEYMQNLDANNSTIWCTQTQIDSSMKGSACLKENVYYRPGRYTRAAYGLESFEKAYQIVNNAISLAHTLIRTPSFAALRNAGKFCGSVWDDHDYGRNNAGTSLSVKPYLREIFLATFQYNCTVNAQPRYQNMLMWDDSNLIADEPGFKFYGYPIVSQRAALQNFAVDITETIPQGLSAIMALVTNENYGFTIGSSAFSGRRADGMNNRIPLPKRYNRDYVNAIDAYLASVHSLPAKGALFQYKIVEKLGKKVSMITLDDQWARFDNEGTDGTYCMQHYGSEQLNLLYNVLKDDSISLHVISTGSPAHNSGMTEYAAASDNYKSCMKERSRFISKINELQSQSARGPAIVWVAGDHHTTYINNVPEYKHASVEFVCSALSQFARAPTGKWPRLGNVLMTDGTFNGNRFCTLDIDFKNERIDFVEHQFVNDKTRIGSTARIAWDEFYHTNSVPVYDERHAKHVDIRMSFQEFSEEGASSQTKEDYTFKYSCRIDGPEIESRLDDYLKATRGTATVHNGKLTGDMMFTVDTDNVVLVSREPFRYVFQIGDIIGPCNFTGSLDEYSRTEVGLLSSAVTGPEMYFSGVWRPRVDLLSGYGPFSNIIFEETFEGPEWTSELDRRSAGNFVGASTGEYMSSALVTSNSTYSLSTGQSVFNFTVNGVTYASEETAGAFKNAPHVMTLVKNHTRWATDPTKPCTETVNGVLQSTAENPIGQGPATKYGCMVGTPHTSTWALFSNTFWAKTVMRGGPFEMIKGKAEGGCDHWRISYKFSTLDGYEPVVHGPYDPSRFPAGGATQHWGETFSQWEPGETDQGMMLNVRSVYYGDAGVTIPNEKYDLAAMYALHDLKENTHIRDQFFALQHKRENFQHYWQVTYDITIGPTIMDNTVTYYINEFPIQKMYRGYKELSALLMWTRLSMYVDDFIISHDCPA